jgi:hypothetical protein
MTSAMATDEVYYRWVDRDGVSQFSSTKPKSIESEKVGPSRHFGYPPLERDKNQDTALADKNTIAAENPSTAPVSALPPDDDQLRRAAALKRTNCRKGQSNLRQLNAYQRINIKTAEGKIRTLSQAEKQAAINRATSLIQASC